MYQPDKLSPDTDKMDEVGARLLWAAQIIRERGWCQHSYGNEHVGYCVLGAIAVVIGTRHIDATFTEEAQRVRHIIGKYNIPFWNDAPDRTVDEILSVLELAARSQRRGE